MALGKASRWSTVAFTAIVLQLSCSAPPPLGPAQYVAPAVGTTYRYIGFTNVVLSSEGWRVRFADDHGREGLRVGLFITDDIKHPSEIDSTALARLWPLHKGAETVVMTRRGRDQSRWMFKVIGEKYVDVPAGNFQTYIVQGVMRPEKLTDPKTETTLAFTWWYAPSINAVVRFETTYVSGPATGQVAISALEGIEAPKTATR
jgi:hypothetical protein